MATKEELQGSLAGLQTLKDTADGVIAQVTKALEGLDAELAQAKQEGFVEGAKSTGIDKIYSQSELEERVKAATDLISTELASVKTELDAVKADLSALKLQFEDAKLLAVKEYADQLKAEFADENASIDAFQAKLAEMFNK